MKLGLIIGALALTLAACTPSTQTSSEAESTGTDTSAVQENSRTGDAMTAEKNIVETAVEAGTFTTLVAAVEAAGLAEALSGPGPFTVLAPTDEAFAKLPEGTVESLLEDPEALAEILKYHVIEGKAMAADVVELDSAPTLQGQSVTIVAHSDGVTINGAKVTTTDIETSNGVIHVIDTVLLPPDES